MRIICGTRAGCSNTHAIATKKEFVSNNKKMNLQNARQNVLLINNNKFKLDIIWTLC